MGQSRQLARILGIFLVISNCASSTFKEQDVPMRMADDSLVVSNYASKESASSQKSVTVAPDDETEYQVYQGVMGRPGVDFPVHPQIPATSFSCRNIKRSGYYADLETDCQVFHICDGGRKISFLCPNGTIFRQSHLICDWWFRVDCGKSVELYEESAEQLAADQKIYKARNEEREKRKKAVLAAHGEEEVYGLDEPYLKPTSAERKSERNSKRVMNADFSNMYPGRLGKSSEEDFGGDRSTAIPISTSTRPRNNFYESFQPAASGGLVNSFHKTQHVFAVDKSLFSTKPTARPELERQHFAESASFASHRGGRTFADFNPNGLQKAEFFTSKPLIFTSTPKPSSYFTSTQKPSFYFTSTQKPSFYFSSTQKPATYFTSTQKPLTFFTSTQKPSSYFTSTQRPSYFTSSTGQFSSTTQRPTTFRIISKPTIKSFSTSPAYKATVPLIRKIENVSPATSSAKPEIDVALQELDIQKTTVEPVTTKVFSGETRDGLQVPPSAGPSALRSFALYFAGDDEKGKKDTFFSENVLIIPIRKKNVLQQVDEVVKSTNVTVEPNEVNTELPSSLTSQTKNSYNALFKTDKNDLTSSQSRGIAEPDSNRIDDYSRIAPDLRELAQVFTKALSAYLDDPEGFRKALSQIRPTEPSPTHEELISASPIEYPSATQEEDEVLEFSDITPKRKEYGETTTEAITTTDIALPLSALNETKVPDTELSLPYETLDESQSNYYTPAPNEIGTTNAIAEEINKEFGVLPEIDSNEALDSYQPVHGSVDDQSRPRYGGFQNNTKYSPYGSELTTPEPRPTTYNPRNRTSDEETELVRDLNSLIPQAPLPLSYQSVDLGNGQVLERDRPTLAPGAVTERDRPTTLAPGEPDPHEINLELSPPVETEPPQEFFGAVTTEKFTTELPTDPPTTARPKSMDRLLELQETLMFNTTDVTPFEKETAREMVEETMKNLTMSDMTAATLTKMMEMAAKNETYRRLVLLLVNDRSGRNKTVEEARVSLLRALLTPVITPPARRGSLRRVKKLEVTTTPRMRVTTASADVMFSKTTARPRVYKTTVKPSTVIGNLGLIRKTIEESRNKEIKVNSLDDAILDSDARAVELLRSLYSLAARWG